MANVNLGIIINATNKAAPVLRAVTKQVEDAKRKAESGETGEGGGSGIRVGGLVRGAAGLGAGALRIMNVALAAAVGLVNTLGSVFGIIGRVGAVAFNAVRSAIGGVVSAATGVIRQLGSIVKWLLLIGAVAIGALARDSINAASEMEGYLAKLTTALKDVKKAQDMLDWAKDFAAKTPFETGEVVDAAVRLEMYGLSAKKWLPLVGDLAGAMGKNATDAVEAVSDAISGGGLERLKEFAITSQKLKAAGWTGSYQDTAGVESLKAALESIIKGNYGGGMDKLSKTGIGALSNFKDAISALKVEIGQALMPAFKQILQYGMKVLDYFKQMGVGTQIGKALGDLALRALPILVNGLRQGAMALGKFILGLRQLVINIRESANFERLTSALSAVWQRLQEFFGGLASGANVGGFIDGVIGRLAGAIEWLLANVLTPGSLAAAVGWAQGLFNGVSTFLSNLVGFVSSNFQALGAWIKYFVGMGQYLVAWAYKHLPDLLDVFVSTFAGIGETVLTQQAVWNGLATGFQVVCDTIAAVVITLSTVIMGALAVVLETVNLLVKGLNAISFGALDGISKPLDEATKKWSQWTRDMAANTNKMWKEVGKDFGEGAQKDIEIEAKLQRFRDIEDRGKAWATDTRNKFAGVPEPVMPTAPKDVQFTPLPPTAFRPGGMGGPVNSGANITLQVNANIDARGATDPAAVQRAGQAGAARAGQEALRMFRRNMGKMGLQPQGTG